MLYLYALAEQPAATPAARGIDGAAVRIDDVLGLAAVVSVLERPPAPSSEEAILAHARVVEAAAEASAAVLPARFGRGYEDVESLGRALREREGELRRALARVRGCVELALRVLAPAGAAPAPSPESGREYMRSRLETVRRARALADELHEPLAAVARASTRSVLPTPRLLLSGAYLVPRDALDGFHARVEELRRTRPELTFACTGPWPPYSFADGEASA